MRQVLLVSHGKMAEGVQSALEMIVGKQENVRSLCMGEESDNIQFEQELKQVIDGISDEVLIIADLLGGTPCNVAVKLYSEDERITILSGMSLPLAIEAVLNPNLNTQELLTSAKNGTKNAKELVQQAQQGQSEAAQEDLEQYSEYKGKANIVNTRIDERLIHGQVAGIWATNLDTQRIIVANDEAARDPLQKSSLRVAAPPSIRLSVLSVADAAKNIEAGKYGKQRIFLLFKKPADVLRYLNDGGNLKEINVGNMSYKEGAREVTKNIQIMPEEEGIFDEIAQNGVSITAQLVPNNPAVDFMKILKG